jgi:hypothetical protein
VDELVQQRVTHDALDLVALAVVVDGRPDAVAEPRAPRRFPPPRRRHSWVFLP